MTKQNQFEQILKSAYNHTDFISFINEFLSGKSDPNCGIKSIAPDFYQEERSNFSYYVDGYYHIGYYNSEENQKILLLSVCLKKGETVERARSMQRNFVKKLIENSNCVGALVAFYTKDEPDKWRFSFIRLDYEFSKGKITEKLTPARRYSYLVGKGEPSATALQRLFPIYENDFDCVTLDNIEEAFSVEKVTNEFYNQYKEKYLELKEYLDRNEDFVKESTERGFTSEEFSKKLIGQIIFLYFLQKKGWLGVNSFPVTLTKKEYDFAFWARTDKRLKDFMPKAYRETENGNYERNSKVLDSLSSEDKEIIASVVKGGDWGTGPRDFMRVIYNDSIKKGKNFFDDCLEELFYTGLNKNRGENCFYPPLCCRIPFLNGGLFEELENYDWRNNHFNIPNEFFSNADKKGRDADGLLDIFDRYNFTMNEDEPMEREVAIDPEMLGKVFENLLDVRDRKSKGAFYTPREIVHYMCQETLINYLSTKTGISEEAIRNFILYGEYFRDSDTVKTKKIEGSKYPVIDKERDLLISDEIFSFKKGVNRLKELDDLLANVKVADLAVGSGAFPVGVLNEIVKARNVLTEYLSIEMNYGEKRHFVLDGRRSYDLKINTIKNCIFACDIEPSAVEIAKLRLWLSIVIDDILTKASEADEQFSEHSKPRPLPNLDCNIICGNSLVDEFQGVKLISQSDLLNNTQSGRQKEFYQVGVDVLILELIECQDKLFFEDNHEKKEQLKQKIQEIYNNIVYEQIKSDPKLTESYFEVIKQHSMPFVLWQLYFPKVFKENGGFDIVIGNPPYVQLQVMHEEADKLQHIGFKTYERTGDIYCLFYEKGYNLLSKNGFLCFITSNKWMRANYGKSLRDFFVKNTNPVQLLDFAGNKIFENATVDVNILLFEKEKNKQQTKACIADSNCRKNISDFFQQNNSNMDFKVGESWVVLSPIEQSIKRKIEAVGTPLKNWDIQINYGIKTGYNDAFIISGEKKDELIKEDQKSADLIRPILRGRDIKRYGYDFADLWLINIHNGIKAQNIPPVDVNNYPAIKRHLDSYWDKLVKRQDKGDTPYNLRNCVYMGDFGKQKIVYRQVSIEMNACIVEKDKFLNDKCYFITGSHLIYLISIFNSKLFNKIFLSSANITGGKGSNFLGNIKLPLPNKEIEEEFLKLYNLRFSENSIYSSGELDHLVDEIVYKLYNLTQEEINYLEK